MKKNEPRYGLTPTTSAADALGRFGPRAQQAVLALQRFAEQERDALRRDLRSDEHRAAHDNAERALDAITERKILFDPRWRSPQNPFGQRLSPQTNAAQPGAEPVRTNSPP